MSISSNITNTLPPNVRFETHARRRQSNRVLRARLRPWSVTKAFSGPSCSIMKGMRFDFTDPTSKHGTIWLILFGFSFASMISAAGRLRPFNTQRIFTSNWWPGAARFLIAIAVLNVAPFVTAVLVLGKLSSWFPATPTWHSLGMLMALSLTVFAWWRVFMAITVPLRGFLYRADVAFEDWNADRSLAELVAYKWWQHLLAALVYLLPFGVAWLLH
jgi:hypothetical protein